MCIVLTLFSCSCFVACTGISRPGVPWFVSFFFAALSTAEVSGFLLLAAALLPAEVSGLSGFTAPVQSSRGPSLSL